MRHSLLAIAVVGGALWAPAALADDASSQEARLARVEQQLAEQTAPSSRESQSAVDAYLASSHSDAALVGGCGSAGYDGGFWIRGGSFLLKINLTIQARYEYFDWKDEAVEPSPGGDLSGFSLPRVLLKLSGDATCDIHYYTEIEFGHRGSFLDTRQLNLTGVHSAVTQSSAEGSGAEVLEAWIEYEPCPQFAWRMGLVKLATTRQMMTGPEEQQFIDVSLASSYIAVWMPGLTDRNRDYGVMVHGALGCDGEWSYLLTVTNGDGPIRRNIWDTSTNDNLAYSARLNWDFMGHMGYEEGALDQNECQWTGAIGAWGFAYDDARDKPHTKLGDRVVWGVDAALGYGSWSLTAAYNSATFRKSVTSGDVDGWSWFGQIGYLFCGTAWEVAARYGQYRDTHAGGSTFGATEWGAVINYYIDGHADKLSADVAFITPDNAGNPLDATYPGYHSTGLSDGMLVRFQWQLSL